MTLSFNGLQPVDFGGRNCEPKINAELQLRLGNIRNFNEEADDVLASAFPNDYDYVRDFLRNRMTTIEKETLQVYLIGGDTGLKHADTFIKARAEENAKAGR